MAAPILLGLCAGFASLRHERFAHLLWHDFGCPPAAQEHVNAKGQEHAALEHGQQDAKHQSSRAPLLGLCAELASCATSALRTYFGTTSAIGRRKHDTL